MSSKGRDQSYQSDLLHIAALTVLLLRPLLLLLLPNSCFSVSRLAASCSYPVTGCQATRNCSTSLSALTELLLLLLLPLLLSMSTPALHLQPSSAAVL
jgi:hypothetical protein